jgi:hypothetical protein
MITHNPGFDMNIQLRLPISPGDQLIAPKNHHLSPGDELFQAAEICKEALAAPKFAGCAKTLPLRPADAEAWFHLLGGYPYHAASVNRIKALKSAWPVSARQAGATFEQYAILQSLTFAAPYAAELPLANSVKRLFANLCHEIAGSDELWAEHYSEGLIDQKGLVFNAEGLLFRDLVWLASLRRFHAGDYVFDCHPVVARSILLKIPPRAIPGFLREIHQGMGGWGPTVLPHINSGRPNQLILQEKEFERSLWRIAKTLEANPEIKGIESHSWLLSAPVGEYSPHLAWMRALYLDAGAYAVDMDPALVDSGFQIGSTKRRQLHQKGDFHPRETLVLWRRADMLAWAASRPDLADPGEEPPLAPAQTGRVVRIPSPSPSKPARHNSPLTLWDGAEMLKLKPKQYILLVILLPALMAPLAAASVAWWAAAPAFMVAFVGAWLFQYYFFQ